MPPHAGRIDIHGNISYAPQEAWVFSGSVKQNILFGQPLNVKRYTRVLNVCALEHDLQQWSDYDNTLVGEKGVILSGKNKNSFLTERAGIRFSLFPGGQRARISLARAIYREADIYLLDDPLSAVDGYVARHLVNYCLKGFLAGKTILLVTHQVQLTRFCDIVYLMNDGKLVSQGTFQDISKAENVAQLLVEDGNGGEMGLVFIDCLNKTLIHNCNLVKGTKMMTTFKVLIWACKN